MKTLYANILLAFLTLAGSLLPIATAPADEHARNSIEDLKFPKSQVEKIYNGNIRKLIKLNVPLTVENNA